MGMQLIAVGQTDTGNQTQPDTTESKVSATVFRQRNGLTLHYF